MGGTKMSQVTIRKISLYISAILFFIAAIRSGYSGYAGLGLGCVALVFAILKKRNSKYKFNIRKVSIQEET